MVPWTDHSTPEGLVVVPPNETELALTSSMRAVIPVKPVTTPASKLIVSPSLVMACGFARSSSAFIVPSHDSVRTTALAGSKVQINTKATNSADDMAILRTAPLLGRWLQLRLQRKGCKVFAGVRFDVRYEECIGAKKHLVTSPHIGPGPGIGPPPGSKSCDTGEYAQWWK